MTDGDRIAELESEVARLRHIEALNHLLEGEVAEVRSRLAKALMTIGTLRDQRDEMTTDMSLMEDHIDELSGRPGLSDYER